MTNILSAIDIGTTTEPGTNFNVATHSSMPVSAAGKPSFHTLPPAKITSWHLARWAIVYVRQSDLQQQVQHPESAATQRRLKERILEWGWPADRILVLEGDSGISGTTTVGRDEFLWLLSEIALQHVGLVAGFQINRLTREDETTCHLINLCRASNTLLADQDGLYHPADFNDRLVLTIKGFMGSVELHQIQQRMQLGRLERARRGAWQGAAPKGYVLGPDGKLILDCDEQVCDAVRQVFAQFARFGSLSALLRHFHETGFELPLRETKTGSKGSLVWRTPHRNAVRFMLRHPAYAGAFTWGRRRSDPQRARKGDRGSGCVEHAPEACDVFLRDNHEAYIDWETYERNVRQLASQRRHGPQPSPRRDTVSLLAGRVVCGRCGAKMQTHYAPKLRYECARRALDYGAERCGSVPGSPIENLAVEQLLAALQPASLELNLAAAEQIESQRAAEDHQWKLRMERAQYNVDRAFRQYNAVEPENRLVARTLEGKWETELTKARTLQEDYDRFRAKQPLTLTSDQRAQIRALADNLPRLWQAASTTVADKRRVVALLLEKVVVGHSGNELVRVELHWTGGIATHHELTRRVRRWEDLSTYETILDHIEKLVVEGRKSGEIADELNAQGYRTPRGAELTSETIRQLRSRSNRVIAKK